VIFQDPCSPPDPAVSIHAPRVGGLNLSQWEDYSSDDRLRLLSEIGSAVRNREMPVQRYVLLHPEARWGAPATLLLDSNRTFKSVDCTTATNDAQPESIRAGSIPRSLRKSSRAHSRADCVCHRSASLH
jgi:hypothetical protein